MQLQLCAVCGRQWFPDRLRCPACRSADFASMTVSEVLVEQVTEDPRRAVWFATIATDQGTRMVARVPPDTWPGERLPLVEESDASGAWVPVSSPRLQGPETRREGEGGQTCKPRSR